MKKIIFLAAIFCSNAVDAGTHFTAQNPITQTAYARHGHLFFVASAAPSTDEAADHVVAVVGPRSTELTGITPKKIYIQGVEQPNPLHGAAVKFLTTTGRREFSLDTLPAVVLEQDPSRAYVISSYTAGNFPSLAVSNELSGKIEALEGSIQGQLFAAISPHAGTFGDPGSGIAYADLIVTPTDETRLVIDALTFRHHAVAITRERPLAIGGPLQSVQQPVLYASSYKATPIFNSKDVGTLFTGYTVVGGSEPTDGAIAVLYSKDEIGTAHLALEPIVVHSAVTEDSIVASVGANTQIYVHHLATLMPSVGTQYLIVVGGVGAEHSKPRAVYALPITSSGQLASIHAQARIIMGMRQFDTPAQQQGDLYTSTSTPARVGGQDAPGLISNVYCSGDTVIVTTESGTYSSQAVFDASCKIAGWTAWQKTLAAPAESKNVVYDRIGSYFWYTCDNRVVRTAWQINDNFKALPGGVTHITELPDGRALLTSNNSITFAQTVPTLSIESTLLYEKLQPLTCSTTINGTLVAGGKGGVMYGEHLLGDYRNVRKLIVHNGLLYVLTDKQFDRINVTTAHTTVLAKARELPDGLHYFFSDALVVGNQLVLATSSGLVKALNGEHPTWQTVPMPEHTGSATRLFLITQADGRQANLYVLSSNVSNNQARLYRYAVDHTHNTIQQLNDFFIHDQPTFFVNIGAYRNFFYTDGLLWATSRSRYLENPLFVQALPDNLKQGFRVRVPEKEGGFFVGATEDTAMNAVGQLTRLTGCGAWVIPGSFGLVIHE